MCRAQCVLAVVALYVGVVRSWDIAVGVGELLIFYNKGTQTNSVRLQSRNLGPLAYDADHNMMLYVDKQNGNDTICGYDLSFMKHKCYIKRNGRNIHDIAYDPRTEILFFTDTNEKSINWISLNRGSYNYIYGNLLIKMDDRTPADIAVDGCKGNIYWTNTNFTEYYLERARFDGSEREGLFNILPLYSLFMAPQEREMYYIDGCKNCSTRFLNRVDLNAEGEHVLLSGTLGILPKELTVSKDYIYWMNSSENYVHLWQLPKNTKRYEEISMFYTHSTPGIAANYDINDQIKGLQDCDSLAILMPKNTIAPGYTNEQFDVCQNYCMQGNCSVNDEGLPKCRCNGGYTGERCEVSACHSYCLNNGNCSLNENSEPVCQCKADYSGDRCEVSACLNHCMHGNYSLNDEGHPTCSCNGGYTGERCEVSACHSYCLNNGNCSLNENSEPVCQCKADYSGDRCEVSACLNYCMQGNCSVNDEGHPICSCSAGYFGKRCETSTCHGYCLNDGDCSLNVEDEPICQCDGNHEGSRCEVVKNNTFTCINTPTTYYSAQKNLTLTDLLLNWRKPTAKISVTVEV